jgi:transcriptional regulator with XRE-family HTH domain
VGRDRKSEELPPIARALDYLLRTYTDANGKHLSVEDVAAAINSKGFSSAYLYALRAGTKRNPTVSTLQTLADFFGVHVGFFFGGPPATASTDAPSLTAATTPVAGTHGNATSSAAVAPTSGHPDAADTSGAATAAPPAESQVAQHNVHDPRRQLGTDTHLPSDVGPMEGTVARAVPPGVNLAARLEHLFTLRLRPDGAPWSMRQVSAAAKRLGVSLSVGFLHDLRRGIKNNPTKQQLECLAEIFGVRPGYFFDDDDTLAAINEKLRTLGALEDDRVAHIALRTRNLSERDYRILNAVIDSAIGTYVSDESSAP